MAVLRMVVVIGTIEIRRHHGDIVRAVLSIQIGTVFQSRNLRKSIRLIRLLKCRGQQAILLHRLRRETRIDTGRAKELQLFAVISPCGMNDVHLQHHILVHKICRSLGVRLNPADLCSSQKHIRRLLLGKKCLNYILPTKIQLRVGTRHNTCIALTFQLTANRRADHPAMPCHIDFCVLFHHRAVLSSLLPTLLCPLSRWMIPPAPRSPPSAPAR